MTDALSLAFNAWMRDEPYLETSRLVEQACEQLLFLAVDIDAFSSALGDPSSAQNQTPQARQRVALLQEAKQRFAGLFGALTGLAAEERHLHPAGDNSVVPRHEPQSPNESRIPPPPLVPKFDPSAPRQWFVPALSDDDPGPRLVQQLLDVAVASEPLVLAASKHVPRERSRSEVREMLHLPSSPGHKQSLAHAMYERINNGIADSAIAVAQAQVDIAQRRAGAMLWSGLGYEPFPSPHRGRSRALEVFNDKVEELGWDCLSRVSVLSQSFDRGAQRYTPTSLWNIARERIIDSRDFHGERKSSESPSDLPATDEHEQEGQALSLLLAEDGEEGARFIEAIDAVFLLLRDDTSPYVGDALTSLRHAGLRWLHEQQRMAELESTGEFVLAFYGQGKLIAYKKQLIRTLSLLAKGLGGDESTVDEASLLGGMPKNAPDSDVLLALRNVIAISEELREDTLQHLVGDMAEFHHVFNEFDRMHTQLTVDTMKAEWSRVPVECDVTEVRRGGDGTQARQILTVGEYLKRPGLPFQNPQDWASVVSYATELDDIEFTIHRAIGLIGEAQWNAVHDKFRRVLIREGIIDKDVPVDITMEALTFHVQGHPEASRPELAGHIVGSALQHTLPVWPAEQRTRLMAFEARGVLDSPVEKAIQRWCRANADGSGLAIPERSLIALRESVAELDALRRRVRDGKAQAHERELLVHGSVHVREALRHILFATPDAILDEIVPPVGGQVVDDRALQALREATERLSNRFTPHMLPQHAMSVLDALDHVAGQTTDEEVSSTSRFARHAVAEALDVCKARTAQMVANWFNDYGPDAGEVALRVMRKSLVDDDRGFRPRNAKRALLLAFWEAGGEVHHGDFQSFRTHQVVRQTMKMPGEPWEVSPSFFTAQTMGQHQPTGRHASPGDASQKLREAMQDVVLLDDRATLDRLEVVARTLQSERIRLEEALAANADDMQAASGLREVDALDAEFDEALERLRSRGERVSHHFQPPMNDPEAFAEYLRLWGEPFRREMLETRRKMTTVVERAGHESDEAQTFEAWEKAFAQSPHTTPLEAARFGLLSAQFQVVRREFGVVSQWLEAGVVPDRQPDLGSPYSDPNRPTRPGDVGAALDSAIAAGESVDGALRSVATEFDLVERRTVNAPAATLMTRLREIPPPFPHGTAQGRGVSEYGVHVTGSELDETLVAARRARSTTPLEGDEIDAIHVGEIGELSDAVDVGSGDLFDSSIVDETVLDADALPIDLPEGVNRSSRKRGLGPPGRSGL